MAIKKVTPKQLEILILLYRFRFLSRHHLQQLLHHKTYNRINAWLRDLTTKKIIGRKYSKKLLANTKPAIYYLDTKSRQILAEQEQVETKLLKRVYREKSRSQRLINHCLTLADFYLQLLKEAPKQKVHFFTKTDLASHYYLPFQRPDAYIAVEENELTKQTKRYFLEIIDPSTPRFILRQKIEIYLNYYDSNKWQTNTGHPFPKLLFLCPDETLKNYLATYLSKKLEEEIDVEMEFYLAVVGQGEKVVWEKVE